MIDYMISFAESNDGECCGIVVEGNKFIPTKNIAKNSYDDFMISSDDYLKAESIGEITGVFHSHPSGFSRLSAADRKTQIEMNVDFYLYCDGEVRKYKPVPHLLGRKYTHGITDCYSIFRDAYHLCGLDMKDYQRDEGWWLRGEDLYIKNLPIEGFYQVEMSEIREGDVLIRKPFDGCDPCHAMIYLNDGRFLHHEMNGFLSRRDNIRPAYIKQMHSLWRHKEWQSLNFQGIYEDFTARSI